MPNSPPSGPRIAVLYLARGADADAIAKFARFRESYLRFRAGTKHRLYVVYKGFDGPAARAQAQDLLSAMAHDAIDCDDEGLDIGAYFKTAARVDADLLCCFNTNSEILSPNWLEKLVVNLSDRVGMVSCSGNFEAPRHPGRDNVPFPNPHLRTNAFLIRRADFLSMRPERDIRDKLDAYMVEHGRDSLSRRFLAQGREILIVGANGRGYEPDAWASSATFRCGNQANLLVADNQTRAYDNAPIGEKHALYRISWEGDPPPSFQNASGMFEQLVATLRRVFRRSDERLTPAKVRASGLFDADWYLQKYADVKGAGADPLEHFIAHGHWELRSPGPNFNSVTYLAAHPEARLMGLSPFEHFIRQAGKPLPARATSPD